MSEQDVDIASALFGAGGEASDAEMDTGASPSKKAKLDGDSESDDDDDDEAFIAAQQAALNRRTALEKAKPGTKKSGGFQTMGLNDKLLKAITRKGFQVPTPIQRKTIPLLLDGQDVVGMARTGSGKTAAFVIPMIDKLRAHSAKVGARAMVLSPSRELALQTLKAVKDFGRGTDLRTVLLVGGDSMEEQFTQMTSNPDIIIATPGRFMHLMIEMSLDLSLVRYVVFDEADRLFEMGFATQLTEILHALPAARQTMLFSATLPKSLVEFAKAGLKDPSLVRLDAESKVSPDLESVFLTIKSADKDGALVHLIQDVIKIPPGSAAAARTTAAAAAAAASGGEGKKRKRPNSNANSLDAPTPCSTIVFAATKHHVEYLTNLLRTAGYAVSHVYGSLDQTARKMQVEQFRSGETNLLVVTDVAARGIDIPMLANVINYDFPPQPKVFVHRVGRTARAGRKGWSYNLVTDRDLPYLVDLQLFLGKRVVLGRKSSNPPRFAEDMVLGAPLRTDLEKTCEWVGKLLAEDADLALMRSVATKGERMYVRSRNAASTESVRRSKTLQADGGLHETNLLYTDLQAHDESMAQRDAMLARISGFRPAETVFEIGRRGQTDNTTDSIRRARDRIHAQQEKRASTAVRDGTGSDDGQGLDAEEFEDELGSDDVDMRQVSDDELEVTFPGSTRAIGSGRGQEGHEQQQQQEDAGRGSHRSSSGWQDEEHFMSYAPRAANAAEDRGYGVHSGGGDSSRQMNFVDAARGATMDLGQDDERGFGVASKPRMRWDKSSKKYVSRDNDEDGSKGAKMIHGESGQKIAASFRSGRFDAWKRSQRLERMPKTGESESSRWQQQQQQAGPAVRGSGGRRFKHHADKAPKRPDKFRDDYHKQKQRQAEARERGSTASSSGVRGHKSELKGVDDVRKARQQQQQRREKNARPSRKKKL